MDHWSLEEFAMVSDAAYIFIAKLLRLIESTQQWPDDIRTSRSAFLSKDTERTDDPLQYRKLTTMPVLYRRWSSTRLKHLIYWTSQWDMPQICARCIIKGAEDGWWRTSRFLVELEAKGLFDQMPR